MIVINKYICVLFLLIFSKIIFSQNIDFSNSNFKSDKKGLKIVKSHLKKGDKFRENAIDNLVNFRNTDINADSAYFYYKMAYDFNPNNADLNYKISSVLVMSNDKEFAKKYLDEALLISVDDFDDEFYFFKAMILQLNKNFNEAYESFQYFKDNSKKKTFKKFSKITNHFISQCKLAPILLVDEEKVWIDNLVINSKDDELSPYLTMDGEILYFSSNRNKSIGDYSSDFDIYYSNLKDRKFLSALPLNEINSSNDDILSAISYDGQRLLHFKQEDDNTDIFESKLNGENWSTSNRMMGDKLTGGNTNNNETFSSYHPRYKTLYYITDYSLGNSDIFYSGIMNQQRNIWSRGQSAGIVNSMLEEGSVYIHPDGKTMYFSSKGHNSIGGYDIFVSYLDDLGHWGKPINLGYPINTTYDELFYIPSASGRYAYMSSNRPGGMGGMDIYKVTFKGNDKPMLLDFEDQLISSIASPISDQIITQPVLINQKSLTVFKGKILDAVTEQPIEAKIDIIINESGQLYTSVISNSSSGKFLMSLPAGANYGISVEAEAYLFHSENFDLPIGDDFNIVNKDILLKNIKIGSNIALNNVFFKTEKWNLTPESFYELDKLVILLEDVPNLEIEISGHTDNTGSKVFNELLSQRRANAVVNYLIDKGIDENRLTAKGYGSSRPIANNDNSQGRALNRRTEFEIINN